MQESSERRKAEVRLRRMPGRRKQQRDFHGNHFLISSENQIVSNDFTDLLYTPFSFICNPATTRLENVWRVFQVRQHQYKKEKAPSHLAIHIAQTRGHFLTSPHRIRDERRSLARPVRSRKLEREPGGERLHTVALNVVPIPHRKRDGHRHSRLELRVVRIAGLQAALDDHAPGRASVTATLD